MTSYDWLDTKDVQIYFSEPLTAASATALGNYSMVNSSGAKVTLSAVALSRDGTVVTLTTSAAVSASTLYTITMSNLATVSGDQLPASIPLSVSWNGTGEIVLKQWQGLDNGTNAANGTGDTIGGDIHNLTNPVLNPNYPNNPTNTQLLTSFNYQPQQLGVVDYGVQVGGYIYPPTTGKYTFWIASDDDSQLWLNSTSGSGGSPAGAKMIASVSTPTSPYDWTANSSQESAQITLYAGQRYYIEALMVHGDDIDDNLSVAWLLPSVSQSTVNFTWSGLMPTSLTASGTTATATFASPPGITLGQAVVINNASPAAYNGTFTVTAVSGNSVSYTMSSSPSSPASSVGDVVPYVASLTCSGSTATATFASAPGFEIGQDILVSAAPYTVSSLTSGGTTTATATLSSTAGLATGDYVSISGATPSGYDTSGTNVVQITVLNNTTITYTVPSGLAAASGTITITPPATYLSSYLDNNQFYQVTGVSGNTITYASVYGAPPPAGGVTIVPYGLSCDGASAIVWLPNNGYMAGNWVDTSVATPTGAIPFGGLQLLPTTSGEVTTNTYTVYAPTVSVSSITYSGTTATVFTSSAVPYSLSYEVQIANATPAVYDGTFAVTVVTGTDDEFTYTLPSTPSANASGANITAQYSFTGVGSGSMSSSLVASIPGAYLGPYGGNIDTTPIPAPANLSTVATSSQISLTWDAVQIPTSGVAFYQIYRNNVGSNGSVVSPLLGSAVSIPSGGLTYSTTTSLATVTLSSAPGLLVGQDVVISGATQAAYDGTFPVAAVSGDTFSYVLSNSTALNPDSGTFTPYVISTGTTYIDSSVSSNTLYTYQVAAVNYDGLFGSLSQPVSVTPVGMTVTTPTTANKTEVLVVFSQPVDPVTAQTIGNYQITNSITVTSAVLQSDDRSVLLTTSSLGTLRDSLTVSGVKTVAGATLPSMTASCTYAASSGYTAPAYTIGVNTLATGTGSPALTGTLSDPTATVTVWVNGNYYAATNNDNGTWTLPAGEITPTLAAGTYSVEATEVSSSGAVEAYNYTYTNGALNLPVNQLTIATTSPTVAISAPASPTFSPVNSITITFSEPVEDFTLQDLQLSLANGGVAASQPLESATLTTTNNQNWVLGNLVGLTTAAGAYTLSVTGLGSGVTDYFGNSLTTGASTSWTLTGPTITIGNPSAAYAKLAATGDLCGDLLRSELQHQHPDRIERHP